MEKKISKHDLINLLVLAACALASAVLFTTTLNMEIEELEIKQWQSR